MSRARGPGEASLAGLGWLASVGPCPLGAWQVAMGWSEPTLFSHASRLITAGLAESCSMRRGHGSLLYATRAGVESTGVDAAPMVREPAPTTWAHWTACGWTAAWLTARGRHVVGSRELQLDESWHGELEWLERDGLRRRGHHPDLAAALTPAGRSLPIEVELTPKSTARLRSVLALHASWVAAGRTDAVIYVCASDKLAARVLRHGDQIGLSPDARTLRVETLHKVREAAIETRAQREHLEQLAAGRG